MAATNPSLVEALEFRTMLAAHTMPTASVSASGNELVVIGYMLRANDIVVREQPTQPASATVTGTTAEDVFTVFDNGSEITITGGPSSDGDTSMVRVIRVCGGRRADNIQIDETAITDSSQKVPADLIGGAGADTLITSAGNDTINGGPGDDTIIAQSSATSTSGTAPFSDILDGGAGDDVIVDNSTGNDLLIGGPGNDTLIAGTGSDTLLGGAGRDRLAGNNTGSAEMVGGAGIDRFLSVGPQDVVEDHQSFDVPLTNPST